MTGWLIAAAIAGTILGIPIGWHAANCTHPAVGSTPPTADRRREHPDQLLTATLTTPAGTRAALAIVRRRRRPSPTTSPRWRRARSERASAFVSQPFGRDRSSDRTPRAQ